MIELSHDTLTVRFPSIHESLTKIGRRWLHDRIEHGELHGLSRYFNHDRLFEERFADRIVDATAVIGFERTLRIPDDGKDYRLPPTFGAFPVRHVDDFAVPDHWKRRGGVMLPMHNSEAMWISFRTGYPMALRIAAGGMCAISGMRWTPDLCGEPQNYVTLPDQPWLDGFRVDPTTVRQFVAVPLGSGSTVEGQLTGEESWGGLQFQAYPMKADCYWESYLQLRFESIWEDLVSRADSYGGTISYCRAMARQSVRLPEAMGLGAGGRITQKIIHDPHGIETWDVTQTSRCFVHLCSAHDWSAITGEEPPTRAPSVDAYNKAGLPWFSHYSATPAVKGETVLKGVKPVKEVAGGASWESGPQGISKGTPTGDGLAEPYLKKLLLDSRTAQWSYTDRLVILLSVLARWDAENFRRLDNLTWPNGSAVLLSSDRQSIERTNRSAQITPLSGSDYFVDTGHDVGAMRKLVKMVMQRLKYGPGLVNQCASLFDKPAGLS